MIMEVKFDGVTQFGPSAKERAREAGAAELEAARAVLRDGADGRRRGTIKMPSEKYRIESGYAAERVDNAGKR